MSIILNGTTGITTPDIDSTAGFDGEDLTGDIAAARITGALNATGSAPVYACRAWVNFNGTSTVAIRASGNVSTITDNGAGDYTVNFTTSMPDTNYAIIGSTGTDSNTNPPSTFNINRIRASGNHVDSTTSAVRVTVDPSSNGDSKYVSVAIFR